MEHRRRADHIGKPLQGSHIASLIEGYRLFYLFQQLMFRHMNRKNSHQRLQSVADDALIFMSNDKRHKSVYKFLLLNTFQSFFDLFILSKAHFHTVQHIFIADQPIRIKGNLFHCLRDLVTNPPKFL